MRVVASVRVLAAMTALGGAYALLIGNAYQARCPGYGRDFGHGDPGLKALDQVGEASFIRNSFSGRKQPYQDLTGG
jgi:hypothetical protein